METEIDDGEIEKILHFVTQEEIKRRREEIRKEPTDAARLLNAVGEDDLLLSLPRSLRSAIKAEGASLTGVKVAEAAIATFHTGALYEHRRALTDLRPPTRWAPLARRRQDEPFLLGLTATPYRGHDESETARLVSRYGSSRLDNGAFSNDDPVAVVRELQAMRVLAQADHETIDGGKYSLNPAEVDEIESMPQPAWLPRSVEKRIADDTERTLGIVAAYQSQVAEQNPEWPTLIFATSVEHSHTVAGLLNMKGVKARAVSGHTDRSVRRSAVDGFRNGKITVLVNYGVFREGFDAPKTRAIVVARPVYSPNLYFQMIGRGLRGPKNGGGERCLIINVQDNIDNFERELAFADLDWLWADAG